MDNVQIWHFAKFFAYIFGTFSKLIVQIRQSAKLNQANCQIWSTLKFGKVPKLFVQFWQIFQLFYCLTNFQFTKSFRGLNTSFPKKPFLMLYSWNGFADPLILFVWIRPRVTMKKKQKSAESGLKRYVLRCEYGIGTHKGAVAFICLI